MQYQICPLFRKSRVNINLMHVVSGVITFYLVASFLRLGPLLITILSFPAVYISPGLLLLFFVQRKQLPSIRQLVVESFIVSTVLNALLVPLFALVGIPTAEGYNIMMVPLLFTALALSLTMRRSVCPSDKLDYLMIFIVMLAYVIMIISLSGLPRFFTHDETDYIFNARAALNGAAYTMGATPYLSDPVALLSGRFFWTFILASFLGSTGLQPYQAYLISPAFLAMTALALTLLVPKDLESERKIHLAILLLVLTNPLVVLFSGIGVLNDLAIAFFATTAVVFFAKSFTSSKEKISLKTSWLLKVLMLVLLTILIKTNLALFFGMWIYFAYVSIRHRLYRPSIGHRILFALLIVLPIAYELLIDAPYVIAVWFLRNQAVGTFLQRFIFVSPLEEILHVFTAPWWSPASTTIFTQGPINCLDYLYTILTPEGLGLAFSALALVLPAILLLKHVRENIQLRATVSVVTITMILYYAIMLGGVGITDVSRYTLPVVLPLILLAVIAYHELFSGASIRSLFLLSMPMIIFLWINYILSEDRQGVFLGFGIQRLNWTYNASVLILFSYVCLIGARTLTNSREFNLKVRLCGRTMQKTIPKIRWKTTFYVLILILLSSNVYFSFSLVSNSENFVNHDLTQMDSVLNKYHAENELVIANNYIYLRPYVSDRVLFENLLPAPITEEEFYDFIKMAPDGTIILISNDQQTSYGFANTYINEFYGRDVILPPQEVSVAKFPRLQHEDVVLNYTFDQVNGTEILDQSNYANNGVIHGAKTIEGYYGNALRFDGGSYVSISDSPSLNITEEITINFLAFIEHPGRYAIISKGYPTNNNASLRGGYYVGTSDQSLYWEIGDDWSLSTPISGYIGNWHHFIFTYDGNAMRIFVDGSLVAEKTQNGLIDTTSYPLELGRDSERTTTERIATYYEGLIDELTISAHSLNTMNLVSQYNYTSYALRVYPENLSTGDLNLFRIVNSVNASGQKSGDIVRGISIQCTQTEDITINLNVLSERPNYITTFIGADDSRFLEVYNTTLQAGSNNVEYWFNYSSPYMYRLSLTHPRIFIIDDKGCIVYNGVVNKFDSRFIQLGFVAIAIAVICIYLLSSPRVRKHFPIVAQRPSVRAIVPVPNALNSCYRLSKLRNRILEMNDG